MIQLYHPWKFIQRILYPNHRDTYTPVFVVALLTAIRKWKHSNVCQQWMMKT